MLRRLIFLLALYVTLDVANPAMPGALSFSVDDSVEARVAHRLWVEDVAAVCTDVPEPLEVVCEVPVLTSLVVGAIRPRRARAPHRRLPEPSSTPSPEED